MRISINGNSRSGWLFAILIILGAWFSLPLLAIGVTIWLVVSPGMVNSLKNRYFVYTLLALTISVINTTKPTSGSDLGYYFWAYNWADSLSFPAYVALIPKEPLFFLYNYLMRIITFGSWGVYITVSTMTMYLLVMFAYDIIYRSHKHADMRYCIAAVMALLLFIEYFLYTAQIVRQVLAGAIAFYGIAKSLYGGKKWALILVVAAGFFHASAFIFCLYIPLYFLRNKGIIIQVLLLIAMMASYMVLLKITGFLIGEDDTIGTAVSRGIQDTVKLEISVGLIPKLICLSIIPMSLIFIIEDNGNTYDSVLYLTALIVPIFIVMNMDNNLFVLRFMEYCYMFIPIYSVMLLSQFKGGGFAIIIMLCCLAVRFCLKLDTSDFTYIPAIKYLFTGLPYYIFK